MMRQVVHANKARSKSHRLLLVGMGFLIQVSLLAHGYDSYTQITKTDLTSYLLGKTNPSPADLQALDFNGDQLVNVADLIAFNNIKNSSTPVAYFTVVSSSASEKASTAQVQVSFSKSFTGTLNYTVSGGTAKAVTDYVQPSGKVQVNGLTAVISIQIVNNALQDGTRSLVLKLVAGTGYTPVAHLAHTLSIVDDDTPPLEASFARLKTDCSESSGTIQIPITFTKSFNGTLRYTVSGTAKAGTDFNALSGSLSVNGTQANIPITILNGATVDGKARFLQLTLSGPSEGALGYLPGPSSIHTVTIQDNDVVWNGTIDNNGTAVHFMMKIVQSSSGASAALVTDGYGIIPMNGTGKEWPATQVRLDASGFYAVVDGITLADSLTLTGGGLKRKLIFSAVPGQVGHTVKRDSMISGSVQEFISSTSQPQLNRQMTGTFALLAPVAVVDPQTPTLTPVQ